MGKFNILITNDDGIHSPGLRAAAKAVMDIGTVTIAAPSHQQTGMGRSLTGNKQARLEQIDYVINGTKVAAYHCECSPALVVRHCLKTIFFNNKPDLLISGINYGENLGFNVTCSGTVGAALESASYGIASIAISKQTEIESHYKHTEQDWSAPSHFLSLFSRSLLAKKMPADVDVIKIDVPINATPETPWKLTRLARTTYFSRILDNPSPDAKISDGTTTVSFDPASLDPESDIHTVAVDKLVSVTPLSTDITSRVTFSRLARILNE